VFTVERVTTFVYYCLNRHAVTGLEPSGEEILKEQTIIVEQIDFLMDILPSILPQKTAEIGQLIQSLLSNPGSDKTCDRRGENETGTEIKSLRASF